jgi:hypothetical protein
MRFRFIRPLHGWREFIHEIVIVVIGVLLALAGAELIEKWRWQIEVASTRQAIANEIVEATDQAAMRLAVEDCNRERISELAAKLKASSGHWTADPLRLAPGAQPSTHWDNLSMGRVYSTPLVGWGQDAWDTAKSNGGLDHMSREEVAADSAVYGEIAAMREYQNQELYIDSSLSYLSADQQLDSGARNDALGKLGQLDALNAVNAGLSSLMIDQVKTLRLKVDHDRNAERLEQAMADERKYRGTCVKDVKVQY